MPASYPILLDVSERLIVIVGGGKVATRKALGLLLAGATRIRVVAPRLDEDMPPDVEKIEARYDASSLEGAGLVFACTDSSQINSQVTTDARARGILVNRADTDDDMPADFVNPAVRRLGPVILSVSSGGTPGLAAELLRQAGEAVDPRLIKLASILQTLRPILRDRCGLSPDCRVRVFRFLTNDEALMAIERDGRAGLIGLLKARFPELVDQPIE
ncbi:MAG TPA: bifunctional precorrin-2 dehydrogenase/sirohydrochlorin ferrochelatase [Tepidisphaeraceae bacterium]|nr:bifunctional precorrin-2 dehydrogenase/sirohydrochlorin ferrochelatase [Tepidisphaeraceae bacterium]